MMGPGRWLMAQCTANSKRSGERCRRMAMKGRNVCYNHGGKSLAGAEATAFKHGRYSRYLPERLVDQYREAMADEEITRLDSEIALVDTKLKDTLGRLHTAGEGPAAWQRVQEAHRQLQRAVAAVDADAMRAGLVLLDGAVDSAREENASWGLILGLVEQRRKLADTERRRLMDEDRAVTIDKLMLLMAAIIDIVRRHVASKEARGAIANEIRCLVSGTGGPS